MDVFSEESKSLILQVYDRGDLIKVAAQKLKCTQKKVKEFLEEEGLNPTNNWKMAVIHSLVKKPTRPDKTFNIIQSKGFNELFKKFPSRLFWEKLSFSEKFESINYLHYPPYPDILESKYGLFKYKIPEEKKIHKKGDYEAPSWKGKRKIRCLNDFMKLESL